MAAYNEEGKGRARRTGVGRGLHVGACNSELARKRARWGRRAGEASGRPRVDEESVRFHSASV